MPDAAWIPYRIPKDFLNKIYRTHSAWIPISFQSPLTNFQQEWGRSKDIKRIDTDEHCDRPAPVRHPCIRSRSGTRFLPPYCLPTWSDRHTAGIRTEYGDHIRFPEEGGNVFHRLVHAVEMLFLLHPVRFPARHGQDAHSRQFRRVPDVTAHESGISSVNPHSAICKYPWWKTVKNDPFG